MVREVAVVVVATADAAAEVRVADAEGATEAVPKVADWREWAGSGVVESAVDDADE